ncbi:MAG: DUF1772 domain-containing protein [Nostoc sp.]|uniref:DUF1772 domain-containing protein n=1 Tax=Nostoc sp. TaxID=1180 RepID=UPI002FF7F257
MHLFNVAAVFSLLLLVGSEFSVSAFVNPSAWRLDPEPQARMLGHYAAVLGKVMPMWYTADLLLLGVETWLYRHTPGFVILLTASVIWFLTVLATILFMVPLNNRVVEGAAGWQGIHRTWDRRHRVRIVVLAVASILFTYVAVR